MRRTLSLLILLSFLLTAFSCLAEEEISYEEGTSYEEEIPYEEETPHEEETPREREIPYYITVDIANQIVTVYKNTDRTESGIVRQMICSTGYGNATPAGTFIMPDPDYEAYERGKWYYFESCKKYAKYASRIYCGILFHSILYRSVTSGPTYNSLHALGEKASHGCVRLRDEDAQWIAENVFGGTEVCIFKDGVRDEHLRELLLSDSFRIEDMSYGEYISMRLPITRGSGRTDEIRNIQIALKLLGYDIGTADGVFGRGTQEGVARWQKDMGYAADGVVTPEQEDELNALLVRETGPDENGYCAVIDLKLN